jgi:uncharacterized protein (TIGR03437 family)
MKSLALILALALATSALAERTVTFAWDATEDADSYTLYVNGAPVASTSNTQITVQLPDARTNVNVTGSNIAGESEPSATLVVPAAPSIPKGFKISKIVRTTTATPK